MSIAFLKTSMMHVRCNGIFFYSSNILSLCLSEGELLHQGTMRHPFFLVRPGAVIEVRGFCGEVCRRGGPTPRGKDNGGLYRFGLLRSVIPYSCAMLIERERLQDLLIGARYCASQNGSSLPQ